MSTCSVITDNASTTGWMKKLSTGVMVLKIATTEVTSIPVVVSRPVPTQNRPLYFSNLGQNGLTTTHSQIFLLVYVSAEFT